MSITGDKMHIKLLRYYTFPHVEGTLDLSGIWETVGVRGLCSDSPVWKVVRRFTYRDNAPLDRVEELPEFIFQHYAFEVSMKNIFGEKKYER
jgi:hypothetical protein